MITVVGGCYAEICLVPQWNRIYGSAGRAAAAISTRTTALLNTLISSKFQNDFLLSMSAAEVSYQFLPEDCSITFQYLHPLASPYLFIEGEKPAVGALPHVRGDNILLFGMIEYSPVVHGERVVYDPQSGTPQFFSRSGSTAKELVYVLNSLELEKIMGTTKLNEAAAQLITQENAVAIVVKRGPLGAAVFFKDGTEINVPCYRARRVFKIGSGDIFAAAFAYFWQAEGEDIETAADLASRAVACYVETQDPYIPTKAELTRDYNDRINGKPGSVYLAAPFFSLEQRWLLEETRALLEMFGCDVFSPFHHVGTGRPNHEIAKQDLEGLQRCNVVLALINDGDIGTVFEIGYGKAREKPVAVYAERNTNRDLTMIAGSGCHVHSDYCSAIYTAVWESGTK